MSRRVGLLGGSFDPFHQGHRQVAEAALISADLAEVIVLPAAVSPHKLATKPAPAEVRYLMALLGTLDHPLLRVERWDLDREGPSYTIDTVRRAQAQLGPEVELSWILGADHVPQLLGWRQAEELLRCCRFLVVPRDELQGMELQAAIARELGPHADRVRPLAMPTVPIAGTRLRDVLAHGGDVEALVPRLTALYLRRYNPYSASDAPWRAT